MALAPTGNASAPCILYDGPGDGYEQFTPTPKPWFAITTGTNKTLSDALSKCCGNVPIAYFSGYDGLLNCWQYCNYTVTSTFTNQSIRTCLSTTLGGGLALLPNMDP
jgi:hypothetical protein